LTPQAINQAIKHSYRGGRLKLSSGVLQGLTNTLQGSRKC